MPPTPLPETKIERITILHFPSIFFSVIVVALMYIAENPTPEMVMSDELGLSLSDSNGYSVNEAYMRKERSVKWNNVRM